MMDVHDRIMAARARSDGRLWSYIDICYKPMIKRNTAYTAGYVHGVNPSCAINSILAFYNFNRSLIESLPDAMIADPLRHVPSYMLDNVMTGFSEWSNDDDDYHPTARGFTSQYTTDPDAGDVGSEWELEFVEIMQKYESSHPELTIGYLADRSVDDIVKEMMMNDMVLVILGAGTMVFFIMTTLGGSGVVKARPWLAFSGIVVVFLGIAAGFGFVALLGIPFYTTNGVLVLLNLGVGIDEIYLIIGTLDRQDVDATPEARMQRTMIKVGHNMTISTVTNLVAFATSILCPVPCISNFCIYGAASLLFVFVMTLVVFTPLVAFDDQRVLSNRHCCTCKVVEDEDVANKPHSCTSGNADDRRACNLDDVIGKRFAPVVTSSVGSWLIIVIVILFTIVMGTFSMVLGVMK